MAKKKVTVSVQLDFGKQILEGVNNPFFLTKLGASSVRLIKAQIASGNSPVRGEGRFKAYAAQRSDASSNYPKDATTQKNYPSKGTRPVNLKLSGDFLRGYKFFIQNAGNITNSFGTTVKRLLFVGYRNPDKRTVNLLATHNEGDNKHVPRRPIIPNVTKGEEFSVSVQQNIIESYRKQVENVINKINRGKK